MVRFTFIFHWLAWRAITILNFTHPTGKIGSPGHRAMVIAHPCVHVFIMLYIVRKCSQYIILLSNSYNETMYSYYDNVQLKSEYCLAKFLLANCKDMHTCTLKTKMYNSFETVVGFLHQGTLESSPFTMEKILDRHGALGTRKASESRQVISCLIHVLHVYNCFVWISKSFCIRNVQCLHKQNFFLHYMIIMTLFWQYILFDSSFWTPVIFPLDS